MGHRSDRAALAEDRRSGHRRAKPHDGAAARTEVTRREGHGEHHQRHGPGVRPCIGHADRRHAETSIRCGSAPIGHGGGERDHKADRQKRRVRLEQDGIRHRHLAIGSLHDGIARSVGHTTQFEQMAARHALEGEDSDITDEGIWSAAVKRPLDVNGLNVAGIDGVADENMPMIGALCKVWRDRYLYNLIRQHTRLPFSSEA